jgi:hypothetical protein
VNLLKAKVCNKTGNITAKWTGQSESGSIETHSAVFTERAKPSLYEAFLNMRTHVAAIIECPALAEKLSPTEITIAHGDNTYVVFKAQMELLSNEYPWEFPTPKKLIDDLPHEARNAIDNLIVEVEEYIKGDRAQMSLENSSES